MNTIKQENSGKGGRQTRIKRREWEADREERREREKEGGEEGKREKELT